MVAMTACEKNMNDEFAVENEKMQVTFAVQGDFGSAAFEYGAVTRSALTADGKDMTDLWVLDYMGGVLVQQLHQTAADADFGTPSLSMDLGAHHIYFVASRGASPTLSTDEHTITWATTSDTFYKDYSVSVTSGTASVQNVTLDRVATKLSITINDEVPTGTAYVEITPVTWYYGLDYLTGAPTSAETSAPRTINIPSSKIGTTGLNLNIFGLSGTTEWTTDVTVTACDGNDNTIGQATIDDAPFMANRVTSYCGNLFTSGGSFALSLNSMWGEDHTGTW